MAPKEVALYTDVFLDYLTCGKCALEFPLQNILDFISHKTSTCCHEEDNQSNLGFSPGTHKPALSCFICLRDFCTARGVLYHFQFEHNLKIFTQKAPLSVERPFLIDDKQSSTAVPQDRNLASPKVTTVTTTSINSVTTVMHICDPVSVTSSRKSNLPVTCAKLASLEGATICCTGSECKVTFNPRKRVLKKCCTSVVPKKRDHHMKEHDSEEADLLHQEQSALETLATLRGRVLLSQKACQKMETCQKMTSYEKTPSYYNSSQDVVWCDETGSCKKTEWQKKPGLCERPSCTTTGNTCDQYKTSESTCEGSEWEEASCDVDSVCDEDCGDVSTTDNDNSRTACSEDSPCKRKIPQKMQIIRIDNEGITSRQTVIMKPGVTVTLSEKPACSVTDSSMMTDTCSIVDTCTRVDSSRRVGTRESVNKQAEHLSSHVYQPVDTSLQQSHSSSTAVDSSKDSTQILAEMMYQTVTHSPTSSILSGQNAQAITLSAMAQPSLVNSVTTSSYAQPQATFLTEPATSLKNSSTSHLPVAVESNHNPRVHSATGTVYSTSGCVHKGVNYPLSTSASATDGHPTVQPADNSQLLDLDGLTSSIQLFESLEQVSGVQHVSNVHPLIEGRSSYNSCGGSGDDVSIKMEEDVAKLTQLARKRRYPTSRPFKCANCDQAFNQRIHLKKHMSKHTGVKPFKCEDCEYSTVERSHLRAHIRIHTGEKPFCCPHCDYATAQNSTLKIHLKRHHSDCNATL